MKVKFNADDNLSVNKPLKLRMLTIIVRSVFKKDGKFYLEVYLDECLYELETMIQLDSIEDSVGIDLDKIDKSKNLIQKFVTDVTGEYNPLKILQ